MPRAYPATPVNFLKNFNIKSNLRKPQARPSSPMRTAKHVLLIIPLTFQSSVAFSVVRDPLDPVRDCNPNDRRSSPKIVAHRGDSSGKEPMEMFPALESAAATTKQRLRDVALFVAKESLSLSVFRPVDVRGGGSKEARRILRVRERVSH